MENEQLAFIIGASVLVGALIPMLLFMAYAFYRASIKIAEMSATVSRTLNHFEVISERVENLSRGLKDGDKDIAFLLKSVGAIGRTIDENKKSINIISAIITAFGPIIVTFIQTRFGSGETQSSDQSQTGSDPEEHSSESPAPGSQEIAVNRGKTNGLMP